MAKTKPHAKQVKKLEKAALNRVAPSPSKAIRPPPSPQILLAQATSQLEQGNIEGSVTLAKQALNSSISGTSATLAALNLLGEVYVELGDIDAARKYFLQAARIDEQDTDEESAGGAEKYLWLAQLSEEGGNDSVGWFDKGVARLRTQIQALLDWKKRDAESDSLLEELRRKLAAALCSVVEVYMTDLSWEDDAEQKCETLVTEATMVAPGIAEPWQTLANVRISQTRMEDAREALKRSMDLWKDLPPEDLAVPDFPTRVSLARLLMEAGMEDEALKVLERLVGEDDRSVEVWYLGGWGLYISGEKQRDEAQGKGNANDESWRVSWISSQQWLNHCLRLYNQQDYEDERLGAHARELIAALNAEIGGDVADELQDGGDDWEDEEDTDDEEMAET